MARLPAISADILLTKLLKIGYVVVRQKGSHIRLHHKTRKPLTVPNHKVIGRGLLRKILRDCEISVEKFITL
ncbi:MAG: type II toxin-antitoxin system HicA family toxin [Candidatus Berkelbacteria bacterium]|nr:type II toxin-antitoxin system HicA family toxin [Candidatus Berkelbacteria bacterium]MCR4308281.1 type II toxin-antitoxin system HicA family toxin [Candidatus Berkelbacteria bacterium]